MNDGQTLKNWLQKIAEVKAPGAALNKIIDKKMSRAWAYNLLEKKEFDLPNLALVCKLFNLEPSYFGRDNSIFDTQYNEEKRTIDVDSLRLFASYYQQKGSHLSRTKYQKAFGAFIKKFYQKISSCLSRAKSTILMYDYLGQERVEISQVIFTEQDHYYERLEKHIKQRPKFKEYRRLLVLPRSISNKYWYDYDKALQHICSVMFPGTFAHVWRCFNDPQIKEVFRLHIVTIPSRPYSFGVIDDDYTFTSYDRYGSKGISRPDLLFINKKTPGTKDRDEILIQLYKDEIDKLSEENEAPVKGAVDAYQLKHALFNKMDNTIDKIAALEDFLKNENFPQPTSTQMKELKKNKGKWGKTRKRLQEIEDKNSTLKHLRFILKDLNEKVKIVRGEF